jgi:hypothetical protein
MKTRIARLVAEYERDHQTRLANYYAKLER